MVDLTKAVQWWQEEQLRILVLASLAIQLFLLCSTTLRKRNSTPSKFRPFIWIAYLGSDSLAIYALATLFNQHKEQGRKNLLMLLWAPILLMHIGGHGDITAYNIEDNELWRRLVFTACSQITVAVYVLCKSWPAGGDKLLLWAAILLFLQGADESIGRAYRLRFGTVDELVLALDRTERTSIFGRGGGRTHADALEKFVEDVRGWVKRPRRRTPPEEDNASATAMRLQPCKQALDLFTPYTDRLPLLESFWVLSDNQACRTLRRGLSDTFDAVYTGRKTKFVARNMMDATKDLDKGLRNKLRRFVMVYILNSHLVFVRNIVLPLVALGLFHKSHKEGYSHGDIKVTYALFGCTVVSHLLAYALNSLHYLSGWPEKVDQYGLLVYFIKRHSRWMQVLQKILVFALHIVGYRHALLIPLYSMEPCGTSSLRGIIKLVRTHLEDGWKKHIHDAAGYMKFNDHRGRMALIRLCGISCDDDHGCRLLQSSLMVPFDESVLLWHMATDLCFYYRKGASPSSHQCSNNAPGCAAWCPGSPHHHKAARCREMSNYMVHLLCENPGMLMVGARRLLFEAAFYELKRIFRESKQPPMDERELALGIIAKATEPVEDSERVFIHDAWDLAKALQELDDDDKMWDLIQSVWVEMLCFSAGRCRGFLHAKSLATGGELLNYIWLMMSYMGMETLAERMQRVEFPSDEGKNTPAAPADTLELHTDATPPPPVSEIRIAYEEGMV